MKYLFESIESQVRLKAILDSWLDPPTPYRHRCGVKGLGCDCIHFVAKTLVELGILKWKKDLIPDYARDWHMHDTRELLKEHIERRLYGQWIPLLNFENGDILLFHFGKAASHAGIYFDGYVYQAIDDIGVKKISADDHFFRKHMKFNYRIGVRE